MKAPCLNCKDRSIYCHSNCNKYKKYREKIDIRKFSKEEFDINDYVYAAIPRMKASRAK